MNIEQQALDIAAEMRVEVMRILREYEGIEHLYYDQMVEDFVEAGMLHVKHLLVCQACDEQRGKVDHV